MSLDVRIKKSFGDYTLDVAFAGGDETLGFLGASGCGKSLTLRCIAGIETPDEGRIVVNGKVFFDSEQKINLTPQQRKTALLFQNYMLFPNLTVADNIFVLRPGFRKRLMQPGILREQIKPFMEDIGMEIPADAYIEDLSTFERFVVELLKAVVAGNHLVVLEDISTFISAASSLMSDFSSA